MANSYKTPGVYIQEKNAFPNTAVAVETAIPVFIGYTQKAERNGKPLLRVPTKVSSLSEYETYFGGDCTPQFLIQDAPADANDGTFFLNGKKMQLLLNIDSYSCFYKSIQLFYANGGNACYVLSVGTYAASEKSFVVQVADFVNDNGSNNVFDILKKEFEPTLVVMPDIHANSKDAYALQQKALAHCNDMQSRFAILDVPQSTPSNLQLDIDQFRNGIGNNYLNYGAAYYPWLNTSITNNSHINYTYLANYLTVLAMLPEAEAQKTVDQIIQAGTTANDQQISEAHKLLLITSPTYKLIMDAMLFKLNLLPPSAAIAGIYTLVDASRGVWKAPANVSLSSVNAPSINISHEQQEALNIDVLTGKSINVIRSFPGIGNLVWGARTLDGNSQDWRYVNVRRTLIMIETSLKLAIRAYVFEANDANTWVTVKSMCSNFLTNLWKQGALVGPAPEDAFDVQVGLGATMIPDDILDGIMRITVNLAIVRPAEFITITFQQMQQTS